MNKMRNLISALLGVLALAALAVGLAWLLGPQGVLPAQQISPVRTPRPPEPSEPITTTLPSLPPLHERHPEIYDENGCVRLPPDEGGGVRCGAPEEVTEHLRDLEKECLQVEPGEVDEELSREADRCIVVKPRLDWENLGGFKGPYYATDLKAGEVVVLEETVTATIKGGWRAWGLVRNESKEPVGEVTVVASLTGADGTILDTPSAQVPVDPLRPGEPGPFALVSQVEAAKVASVKWSVESGSPNLRVPLEAREVELEPSRTVVYGVSSPFRSKLQEIGLLKADDSYPYVLCGSMQNWSQVELPEPGVVAAWLDSEGRVVWVAETELKMRGGSPLPALAPNDPESFDDWAAFCLAVSDPQVGPRLNNYMLWGVGR